MAINNIFIRNANNYRLLPFLPLLDRSRYLSGLNDCFSCKWTSTPLWLWLGSSGTTLWRVQLHLINILDTLKHRIPIRLIRWLAVVAVVVVGIVIVVRVFELYWMMVVAFCTQYSQIMIISNNIKFMGEWDSLSLYTIFANGWYAWCTHAICCHIIRIAFVFSLPQFGNMGSC